MDKDNIIAQYNVDVGLMDKFEQYGVYAIEEPSFGKPFILNDLIRIDAKSLFSPTSSASLAKVATLKGIMMLNLIWVYLRSTQKLCYAILHWIDVGIVIMLPLMFYY
ncbi:hypothetical protein V6N13_127123 [Hibiscus sabdariffa]|uniref:PAS fold-2 domain-containing protein n=1 Tax=Hibiscus sabdariffa TaxID=183260 RepID=A0ABR2RDF4_9ROSI